jgi:hypothetical protein
MTHDKLDATSVESASNSEDAKLLMAYTGEANMLDACVAFHQEEAMTSLGFDYGYAIAITGETNKHEARKKFIAGLLAGNRP